MDSFIGQIITVGFNFAPQGWLMCQGQQLSIQQNTALFSLLGTTFGGDGQQNFKLPDLRGRAAVGTGQGTGLSPYNPGQMGGVETVTISQAQLPQHTHPATFTSTATLSAAANVQGTTVGPAANSVLGRGVDIGGGTAKPAIYAPAGSTLDTQLAGLNVAGTVAVGQAGGSAPVPVLSPYLALNQIIAVQGIYPSRP